MGKRVFPLFGNGVIIDIVSKSGQLSVISAPCPLTVCPLTLGSFPFLKPASPPAWPSSMPPLNPAGPYLRAPHQSQRCLHLLCLKTASLNVKCLFPRYHPSASPSLMQVRARSWRPIMSWPWCYQTAPKLALLSRTIPSPTWLLIPPLSPLLVFLAFFFFFMFCLLFSVC